MIGFVFFLLCLLLLFDLFLFALLSFVQTLNRDSVIQYTMIKPERYCDMRDVCFWVNFKLFDVLVIIPEFGLRRSTVKQLDDVNSFLVFCCILGFAQLLFVSGSQRFLTFLRHRLFSYSILLNWNKKNGFFIVVFFRFFF